MLHRRAVDALDSSAPLLFLEAMHGSGKWTVLRQWEDGLGSRHGEIRLLFHAEGLPTTSAGLTRMLCTALRHQRGQDLMDLPEDDTLLDDAVSSGLRSRSRDACTSGGRSMSSRRDGEGRRAAVLSHASDERGLRATRYALLAVPGDEPALDVVEVTDPDGDALTVMRDGRGVWVTCTSAADEVTLGPFPVDTLEKALGTLAAVSQRG